MLAITVETIDDNLFTNLVLYGRMQGKDVDGHFNTFQSFALKRAKIAGIAVFNNFSDEVIQQTLEALCTVEFNNEFEKLVFTSNRNSYRLSDVKAPVMSSPDSERAGFIFTIDNIY